MCSILGGRPHPKSKFSYDEDEKLKRIVNKFGSENWNSIAKKMRGRTPRQCRERWLNYLDPKINKSEWTDEEDKLLYDKFNEIGRKWKIIASFFDNRTDINIKNRWLMLERRRKKEERSQQNEKSSEKESASEEESEPKVKEKTTEKETPEIPIDNTNSLEKDFLFKSQVENVDSLFEFTEAFDDWFSIPF